VLGSARRRQYNGDLCTGCIASCSVVHLCEVGAKNKKMKYVNNGDQSDNSGFTVGAGDFRGANLSFNNNGKPIFDWDDLNVRSHVVRKIPDRSSLAVLGAIGSAASIIGLATTVVKTDISPLAVIMPALIVILFSIIPVVMSSALRHRRFEPFFGRSLFLQADGDSDVYVTKLYADCPWCRNHGRSARMRLKNVNPKNTERYDLLVCERNPRQHTIEFDPTMLSDDINSRQGNS